MRSPWQPWARVGTAGAPRSCAYAETVSSENCPQNAPICGILDAMIGRWARPTRTVGLRPPGPPPPAVGPEHRVAALTLAALLVLGGLVGGQPVRRGRPAGRRHRRWIYGRHGGVPGCRGTAGRAAARRPLADVRPGPAGRPDLRGRRALHRGPGPLRDPADAAVPVLRGRLVPGSVEARASTWSSRRWPACSRCGPATTASGARRPGAASAPACSTCARRGVPAAPPRAAAPRRDPGAVPPRPADRPVQPPLPRRAGAAHLAPGPPRRHPRGGDGARPRPLQAAQRRARSRRRGRRPLRGRRRAGRDGPARPTSWPGPAARSWSSWAWSATPTRRAGWPSACGSRSRAPAPPTGTR